MTGHPAVHGGASEESDLDFWNRRLAGASRVVTLPIDLPRAGGAHSSVKANFAGSARHALGRLAQAEALSLEVLLLAAWQCLLSRWTGQNDLIVFARAFDMSEATDVTTAERAQCLLPYRADLSDDISFREALGQIGTTVREVREHLNVPREWLAPTTDPARSCCAQVRFTSHRAVQSAFSAGGPPLDLGLSVAVHDMSIELDIHYAQSLFRPDTIEALGDQLVTLLAGVAVDPDRAVSRLPLASDRERAALESSWWPLDRVDRQTQCLHEVIAAQARRNPQAVALVCDGQRLSYQELDSRAERLAAYLAHLGARPDVLIGVCAERSLDLVIGILAVLKSGGAYLPLDAAVPADRLAYILQDAAVPILLTQRHLAARFPTTTAEVVYLDDLPEQLPAALIHASSSKNLAYCIYTSGSTGRPKGVLVSHANVIRLLTATQPQFQFDMADTWTLFHSCAFDFSVWELFGCLAYGGRLVLVPLLVAQSPDLFFDLLERESVTVLNMTPAAFRGLASVARDRQILPSLRVVIFGGEVLYPATLTAWTSQYGWDRPELVNMYGITETTVHVTYRRLRPEDVLFPGRSPIGRPLDHLGIRLLDPDGNPVPRGVPGEIYVSGMGVSQGFLNRPELTMERFLPEGPGGSGRLYRTGDVGRMALDGELEYRGRTDQQVKLRGYRIELGEIEASLTAIVPVAQAAVALVGETSEEARIVAWITVSPEAQVDLTWLRAEAAKKLPAFMLPARIVVLPTLPLNNNSKIDRAMLVTMLDSSRPDGGPFSPPQTPHEEALGVVWEQVLDVRPVGTADNFFALGGDSMLALQVVQAARERGVLITLRNLLTLETLAELAATARAAPDTARYEKDAVSTTAALVHNRASADNRYPISAMQQLMLNGYSGNARHGIGIYHAQHALRFHNRNASAALLDEALSRVIRAHPVLRTTFHLDATGGPQQEVLPEVDRDFREIDISSLSAEGQHAALRRAMVEDRRTPFRQGERAAPLLRLRMLRRDEEEFDLLISSHHAIEDGWGSQQFLHDLLTTYTGLQSGLTPELEPRANVFRDFIALEARRAVAPEVAQFWRECQARVTHGPAPLPPPPDPSTAQRNDFETTFEFPLEAMHRTREAAMRYRVSIKSVLLTVYQAALAEVLNWPAPSIGVVASGRTTDLPEPLTTLGMFWSFVPFATPALPVDGAGFQATLDLLTALEANANALGGLLRDPIARGELFSATFNFVDLHNTPVRNKSEQLAGRFVLGYDKFHYPLNGLFSIDPENRSLSLHVEFDHERVTVAAVRKLEGCVADLLYRLS